MIRAVGTALEWFILAFPILSVYVTYAHLRWWNLYKPSPLIKHLLISSVVVDISSTIVAFVAATILFDIDTPDGLNTILVGAALILALSVKVWRRIDLRALDQPNSDIEQRVETQNEREDRQFGEKRRDLEETHREIRVDRKD